MCKDFGRMFDNSVPACAHTHTHNTHTHTHTEVYQFLKSKEGWQYVGIHVTKSFTLVQYL